MSAAAPFEAPDLCERLMRVRLLLLDVDGVLTDGRIIVDDRGCETKNYYVRDGLGIALLRRAGIPTAIISGRYSAATTVRARELKIEPCIQASQDKVASFADVARHHGVSLDEVAFMGDDILDVALLRRVGAAAAPGDGVPEAKAAAHLVTFASGGHGAVRELCDRILKAKGLYERIIEEGYGVTR